MKDITTNLTYIAVLTLVIIMLLYSMDNGYSYALYIIQALMVIIGTIFGYIMGLCANYQPKVQNPSKTVLVASESKPIVTTRPKKKLDVRAKV